MKLAKYHNRCTACEEPCWVLMKCDPRDSSTWLEATCDTCCEPVCRTHAEVGEEGRITCTLCALDARVRRD